jgi:hypothetical protein
VLTLLLRTIYFRVQLDLAAMTAMKKPKALSRNWHSSAICEKSNGWASDQASMWQAA